MPDERRGLIAQVDSLDFDMLRWLYENRDRKAALPSDGAIAPLPRPVLDEEQEAKYRRIGEAGYRAGEVAFLIVAGGQGSRLGFDHPKGLFPVGPVSGKSLFQMHAEKTHALTRRFLAPIPLLIMTSPATHDETVAFFEQHHFFGLDPATVWFFMQGTMPALCLESGRLLMEKKHRVFLSPDGHGGTLTGLADRGLFDALRPFRIRTLFYFQVDNPMVNLADFAFIGRHLANDIDVSSKVVAKQFPTEKLGNFALIDGKLGIIEYSDLPSSLALATDEHGRPKLWAGNTAIHLFDIRFLERVVGIAEGIPWHIAKKKVSHLHPSGERVEPMTENALKFERFIFDVLPHAERWSVTPTTRADEFEPLKNAEGPESPATVRRALINHAGRWLAEAGVCVPRDHAGDVTSPLEISPLFALDKEELQTKISRTIKIDGPLYLE